MWISVYKVMGVVMICLVLVVCLQMILVKEDARQERVYASFQDGDLCGLKKTYERQTDPSQETAVLERFEGNQAILLFEDTEEEMVIPRDFLPVYADVNTWLNVSLNRKQYMRFSINWAKTEREKINSSILRERLKWKRDLD